MKTERNKNVVYTFPQNEAIESVVELYCKVWIVMPDITAEIDSMRHCCTVSRIRHSLLKLPCTINLINISVSVKNSKLSNDGGTRTHVFGYVFASVYEEIKIQGFNEL